MFFVILISAAGFIFYSDVCPPYVPLAPSSGRLAASHVKGRATNESWDWLVPNKSVETDFFLLFLLYKIIWHINRYGTRSVLSSCDISLKWKKKSHSFHLCGTLQCVSHVEWDSIVETKGQWKNSVIASLDWRISLIHQTNVMSLYLWEVCFWTALCTLFIGIW